MSTATRDPLEPRFREQDLSSVKRPLTHYLMDVPPGRAIEVEGPADNPIIDWRRLRETFGAQSTTDRDGYASLFKQLVELFSGDESDEYGILRPSSYAFQRTLDVLGRAHRTIISQAAHLGVLRGLPPGDVTSDEQGGVRIEWSNSDGSVFLAVPSEKSGRAYIYHRLGENYGANDDVKGRVLAQWLLKLFK